MIEKHRPIRKTLIWILIVVVWAIIMYLQLGEFGASFLGTCDSSTGECQPISK